MFALRSFSRSPGLRLALLAAWALTLAALAGGCAHGHRPAPAQDTPDPQTALAEARRLVGAWLASESAGLRGHGRAEALAALDAARGPAAPGRVLERLAVDLCHDAVARGSAGSAVVACAGLWASPRPRPAADDQRL